MTKRTRDQINEAAERAEAELDALDENAPAPVRTRQAGETSQVYSIRIPSTFVERIRQLADARDEASSAMLRRWVLERLEVEVAGRGAETPRSDLENVLEHAVTRVLQRRGLLDIKVYADTNVLQDVDPKLLDPSGPVRLGKSRLGRQALSLSKEAAQ